MASSSKIDISAWRRKRLVAQGSSEPVVADLVRLVMVSKHTVRQALVPVADLSEEEAEDFKEKAASAEGSASERAARRADVPHNSARLV